MTAPDDLSATLAGIKDRAAVFAKLGPPRPALGFGSEIYNAAIASAGDVAALVAFAEMALALADGWTAEAERLQGVAREQAVAGTDKQRRGTTGGLAVAHADCARALREAIIAALTRDEPPGA
jgi:hypothetical protein